MKIIHIKKEETKPMAWASGTTTELFIYPSTGNFLTRDFLFRISTATVEAEETTFSDFSGLTRILMPLQGKLTLIHEGRYTKSMVPFEQDTFDGGWSTKSKGKVRDFNVMFKAPANSKLQVFSMDKFQKEERKFTSSFVVFYSNRGAFECNDFLLNNGDLLIFEEVIDSKINLTCKESGELLIIEVSMS
jgi:environmental stress-induced protein Ves